MLVSSERGSNLVGDLLTLNHHSLPPISPEEFSQLRKHLAMHVQLLVQRLFTCAAREELTTYSEDARNMLLELDKYANYSETIRLNGQFSSVYRVPNLQPAVFIAENFAGFSTCPPTAEEVFRSQKFEMMMMPNLLCELMLTSPAFPYSAIFPPGMMPVIHNIGSKNESGKEFSARSSWSEPEENLMALGLLQFAHLQNPFSAIHRYLLPTKTSRQMRSHRDSLMFKIKSKNENLYRVLQEIRGVRQMMSKGVGSSVTVTRFSLPDKLDELEAPDWESGNQSVFNRHNQWLSLPRVFKDFLNICCPQRCKELNFRESKVYTFHVYRKCLLQSRFFSNKDQIPDIQFVWKNDNCPEKETAIVDKEIAKKISTYYRRKLEDLKTKSGNMTRAVNCSLKMPTVAEILSWKHLSNCNDISKTKNYCSEFRASESEKTGARSTTSSMGYHVSKNSVDDGLIPSISEASNEDILPTNEECQVDTSTSNLDFSIEELAFLRAENFSGTAFEEESSKTEIESSSVVQLRKQLGMRNKTHVLNASLGRKLSKNSGASHCKSATMVQQVLNTGECNLVQTFMIFLPSGKTALANVVLPVSSSQSEEGKLYEQTNIVEVCHSQENNVSTEAFNKTAFVEDTCKNVAVTSENDSQSAELSDNILEESYKSEKFKDMKKLVVCELNSLRSLNQTHIVHSSNVVKCQLVKENVETSVQRPAVSISKKPVSEEQMALDVVKAVKQLDELNTMRKEWRHAKSSNHSVDTDEQDDPCTSNEKMYLLNSTDVEEGPEDLQQCERMKVLEYNPIEAVSVPVFASDNSATPSYNSNNRSTDATVPLVGASSIDVLDPNSYKVLLTRLRRRPAPRQYWENTANSMFDDSTDPEGIADEADLIYGRQFLNLTEQLLPEEKHAKLLEKLYEFALLPQERLDPGQWLQAMEEELQDAPLALREWLPGFLSNETASKCHRLADFQRVNGSRLFARQLERQLPASRIIYNRFVRGLRLMLRTASEKDGVDGNLESTFRFLAVHLKNYPWLLAELLCLDPERPTQQVQPDAPESFEDIDLETSDPQALFEDIRALPKRPRGECSCSCHWDCDQSQRRSAHHCKLCALRLRQDGATIFEEHPLGTHYALVEFPAGFTPLAKLPPVQEKTTRREVIVHGWKKPRRRSRSQCRQPKIRATGESVARTIKDILSQNVEKDEVEQSEVETEIETEAEAEADGETEGEWWRAEDEILLETCQAHGYSDKTIKDVAARLGRDPDTVRRRFHTLMDIYMQTEYQNVKK